MSEWRNIYQRFAQLEKEWSVHDDPRVNRHLFQTAVLSEKTDAQVYQEFAQFNATRPGPAEAREASDLRPVLNITGGRFPNDPCEDVYQAALTMMPRGVWTASPTHEQLYRGQRDARWPVVPSFFRQSHEKQAEGVARINALAKQIAARRPELQPEQTLALIQHYSKELAAPTWLIDLTWDPAVALFFASDGGLTGDIGVVTMVARREWAQFAAGGRNRLGEIRVIEVPDVLRIERQRALFLDTSHPDLLEQYVAYSVWFRQVDGLTFEDLDAAWPVSQGRCYPEFDPTLEEVLKGLEPVEEAEGVEPALAPAFDASERLGADDYVDIARSWCDEDDVILEPDYEEALERVCLIHSRLQEYRDDLSIHLRSLHRLREATKMIRRAQERRQEIDVSQAMRFTLERSMKEAEQELMEELVMEAKRDKPNKPTIDLPEFVSDVLRDLTPELAELVVIGVAEHSDKRVQRDKDAFLDAGGFRVFDLRGDPEIHGIGALATEVNNAVRLLIVDHNTERSWIDRLVRAVLDGHDHIEFAMGSVERPPGQSIVIVWYNAKNIAELPRMVRELIVQFVE